MVKIIKREKSEPKMVQQKHIHFLEMDLVEYVVEIIEKTHYNNGLISKRKYKYYIETFKNGGIRNGEVAIDGIMHHISNDKCLDILLSVDLNKY